jgi:diguanylate cyclase (GGDEF)-like protein/PAS domain S-box-containing protein
VKWVSTTKMPIRDKAGRTIGTFGISHDITGLIEAKDALAEQAELLATLMEGVPDRIFFKDARSRFLRVNRAQAERFGLASPEEAVGKTDFDFFPREEAERFLHDEREIMRTGLPMVGKEEKRTLPDGTVRWTSSTKLPLRDRAGRVVGTFGINRDITGLKRAEEALAEQAELLQTLMDNVPDFIFFKDAEGRFTRVNRALAARLGLEDAAQAEGKSDADFFDRELAEAARKDEQEIIRTGRPIIAKEERERFPRGEVIWVSTTKMPLCDRNERIVGTFGISRDVTERKRAEEQLTHQAFYDPLTQLPNRALFMDRLGHRFRRARRDGGAPFAILFLDLDRFKGVNDSLGHEAGDNLLVTTARRLETCLRPGDTVARLGGDEFTVLLDSVADAGDAVRIADRVQAALAAACNLGGVEVFTTASIGIALSAAHYERPEDLLRDADTAMYRAKAHGKARHEIFDAAMHERAVTLLQLETDLRRAVDRGEFRLFYQPVVALADGRLTGFEALVRWPHPQRGLILPDAFIPLAEETGLIAPLGLWVLREACRQTREWQIRFPADPPLRVSVNVSSRQFAQKDFVDQVRHILAETGLDPATLTLEITESAIMENVKATASILGQIRALSIQLYIDDFGTGYSSLSQLHQFPINTLKVDRSFVSRMDAERDRSEIVGTIVSLARNLGMNVTAEGVETQEQLDLLRQLQCGSAQGFFFSKPLEMTDAEALLGKGPLWPPAPPAGGPAVSK